MIMPFFKKRLRPIPLRQFEVKPFDKPPGPGELNEFETNLLNFEIRRYLVVVAFSMVFLIVPVVLAIRHEAISPKRELSLAGIAITVGMAVFFSVLALVGRFGLIPSMMKAPLRKEPSYCLASWA